MRAVHEELESGQMTVVVAAEPADQLYSSVSGGTAVLLASPGTCSGRLNGLMAPRSLGFLAGRGEPKGTEMLALRVYGVRMNQ